MTETEVKQEQIAASIGCVANAVFTTVASTVISLGNAIGGGKFPFSILSGMFKTSTDHLQNDIPDGTESFLHLFCLEEIPNGA